MPNWDPELSPKQRPPSSSQAAGAAAMAPLQLEKSFGSAELNETLKVGQTAAVISSEFPSPTSLLPTISELHRWQRPVVRANPQWAADWRREDLDPGPYYWRPRRRTGCGRPGRGGWVLLEL